MEAIINLAVADIDSELSKTHTRVEDVKKPRRAYDWFRVCLGKEESNKQAARNLGLHFSVFASKAWKGKLENDAGHGLEMIKRKMKELEALDLERYESQMAEVELNEGVVARTVDLSYSIVEEEENKMVFKPEDVRRARTAYGFFIHFVNNPSNRAVWESQGSNLFSYASDAWNGRIPYSDSRVTLQDIKRHMEALAQRDARRFERQWASVGGESIRKREPQRTNDNSDKKRTKKNEKREEKEKDMKEKQKEKREKEKEMERKRIEKEKERKRKEKEKEMKRKEKELKERKKPKITLTDFASRNSIPGRAGVKNNKERERLIVDWLRGGTKKPQRDDMKMLMRNLKIEFNEKDLQDELIRKLCRGLEEHLRSE